MDALKGVYSFNHNFHNCTITPRWIIYSTIFSSIVQSSRWSLYFEFIFWIPFSTIVQSTQGGVYILSLYFPQLYNQLKVDALKAAATTYTDYIADYPDPDSACFKSQDSLWMRKTEINYKVYHRNSVIAHRIRTTEARLKYVDNSNAILLLLSKLQNGYNVLGREPCVWFP